MLTYFCSDDLAALEGIEFGGGIYLDFTLGASIDIENLASGDYGNGVEIFATINQFNATAFLRGHNVSMDLPFTLPTSALSDDAEDTQMVVGVESGSFDLTFFVSNTEPVNIIDLFTGDQTLSSSIDYGGSFDSALPVEVEFLNVTLPIELFITNENMFDNPIPTVDYRIDVCVITSAMMELFAQLKDQILNMILSMFEEAVEFMDNLVGPLAEYIDNTLSIFIRSVTVNVDGECGTDTTDSPSMSISPSESTSPTNRPSVSTSPSASTSPTIEPSREPTSKPTDGPSREPSESPSSQPSENPSISDEPSFYPSISHDPTGNPTTSPTMAPTLEPTISNSTAAPTAKSSMASIFGDALEFVAAALQDLGVKLEASSESYFSCEGLVVGVQTDIKVGW